MSKPGPGINNNAGKNAQLQNEEEPSKKANLTTPKQEDTGRSKEDEDLVMAKKRRSSMEDYKEETGRSKEDDELSLAKKKRAQKEKDDAEQSPRREESKLLVDDGMPIEIENSGDFWNADNKPNDVPVPFTGRDKEEDYNIPSRLESEENERPEETTRPVKVNPIDAYDMPYDDESIQETN
jgi:hypothetical protein